MSRTLTREPSSSGVDRNPYSHRPSPPVTWGRPPHPRPSSVHPCDRTAPVVVWGPSGVVTLGDVSFLYSPSETHTPNLGPGLEQTESSATSIPTEPTHLRVPLRSPVDPTWEWGEQRNVCLWDDDVRLAARDTRTTGRPVTPGATRHTYLRVTVRTQDRETRPVVSGTQRGPSGPNPGRDPNPKGSTRSTRSGEPTTGYGHGHASPPVCAGWSHWTRRSMDEGTDGGEQNSDPFTSLAGLGGLGGLVDGVPTRGGPRTW